MLVYEWAASRIKNIAILNAFCLYADIPNLSYLLHISFSDF